MDSPHFMKFCFLLLGLAAPHPNIAMSSDSCAEGTQDSCSSETNVTIYNCRDCEGNVCKLSDYGGFVKIAETQNKVFSNEEIQLVTSKTHITMCFQQKNPFPEGVYAIVWEKAIGAGDSCGILDFEAFSENVSDSFIRICCEVETNPAVSNHPMKCGIRTSGEKDSKSTADINSGRILDYHQISIGGNSSIGIIILVLIIMVCAAAVVLRVRHVRQNRPPQSQL